MIIRIILLALILLSGAGSAFADVPVVNGTVKNVDGQGRLQSVLKYKEGHLLRKRIYSTNGRLILDTSYRNGEPVVIKTYYLNGQLKSVWSKKSNEARFFYPTGGQQITVPGADPARLAQ